MSRPDKSQIILDFKKQRIEAPKDLASHLLLKPLRGTQFKIIDLTYLE